LKTGAVGSCRQSLLCTVISANHINIEQHFCCCTDYHPQSQVQLCCKTNGEECSSSVGYTLLALLCQVTASHNFSFFLHFSYPLCGEGQICMAFRWKCSIPSGETHCFPHSCFNSLSNFALLHWSASVYTVLSTIKPLSLCFS